MHNLWRAKLLYDLNYGQPNFRSRDSKKVQEILTAAGKGSYAALGVERKRYNVSVQRFILKSHNVQQYRARQICALFFLDLCKLFVLIAVSEFLLCDTANRKAIR